MNMWGYWGNLWEIDDPISIDGPNKQIFIHPQVTTISTVEIYSAWVRWAGLYDQLKFAPAFRTSGGEEIPGGQYTGVFIFLINGWQIVVDHNITIEGILYQEDPNLSPFILLPGGGITNKVAALAFQYAQSSYSVTDIVNAVWAKNVAELNDKTTIGGFLSKSVLTISKFIGLK